MTSLRASLDRAGHVVTQIIKTKLIVRSVGHICPISLISVDEGELMDILLR